MMGDSDGRGNGNGNGDEADTHCCEKQQDQHDQPVEIRCAATGAAVAENAPVEVNAFNIKRNWSARLIASTTSAATTAIMKQQREGDYFPSGCLFSPDGTCILTSRCNRVELYNTPMTPRRAGTTCQNDDDNNDDSDPGATAPLPVQLKPVLTYPTGGTVRCYRWYPHMNSNDRSSSCFVVASRDQPAVHLWDAYETTIRASYRPTNRLDEGEAPTCLEFIENGSKLATGGFLTDRMVQIFDLDRPGKNPTLTIKLGQTRRSKDGQKGLLSSMAYNESNGLLAVGTYSPGSIYLYDVRQYCRSPVSEIIASPGTTIGSLCDSHNNDNNFGGSICISGHGKKFRSSNNNHRRRRKKGKGNTQQQSVQVPSVHTDNISTRGSRKRKVLSTVDERDESIKSARRDNDDDHDDVDDYDENNDVEGKNQKLLDDDNYGDDDDNDDVWIDFSRAKQQWYQSRTRTGVTQLKFFDPSSSSPSSVEATGDPRYLLSTSRRSNVIIQYDLRMLSGTGQQQQSSPYGLQRRGRSICPAVASYELDNNTNQRIEFDVSSSSPQSWLWTGGNDGYVRSYPLPGDTSGSDTTSIVQPWTQKISCTASGRQRSSCNCCVNGISVHSSPYDSRDTLLTVALGNRSFPCENDWNGYDSDLESPMVPASTSSTLIAESTTAARGCCEDGSLQVYRLVQGPATQRVGHNKLV